MATAKPSQPKFCTDCRHSFRPWMLFLSREPRCRLRPFDPNAGLYMATGRAAKVDPANSHWLCSSERLSGADSEGSRPSIPR
jgi:hypothetical protein